MSERDGEPTQSSANRAGERELSERMRELDRQLDARRETRETKEREALQPSPNQGYGLAARLGADFIAGIIVGGAIGWGVDRLFGISPWGLMAFLLLGFAAGVLTALRSAGLIKPGPPGPDDRKV